MQVLLNALPGFRDLRAPLIAGYLWLLFAWLLAHDELEEHKNDSLQALVTLGDEIGRIAVAIAASFGAYLIGAVSQTAFQALGQGLARTRLGSFLVGGDAEPPPMGSTVETTSSAGISIFWMRIESRRTAVQQFRSPVDAIDEVEQRAGDVRDILAPALDRARQFTAENEELFEDASANSRLVERLFLLVKETRQELDLPATLLVADQPLLFGEVDRVRAEAELRLAVVPPLLAVCFALSAIWTWWIIGAIPVCIALLYDGLVKRQEGRSLIRNAMAMGKASSNAVRQFQGWIEASPQATRSARTQQSHHRLLEQRGDTAWTFSVDDSGPQGAFATADEAERAAKAYVHDRRWNAVVETRVTEFVGGPFGLASGGPTVEQEAEPEA